MPSSAGAIDWAIFAGAVLGTMVLDRALFGGVHRVSFREALVRSLMWLLVALGFAGAVLVRLGHPAALTFVVAYLVEQSLSVDNLFVFLVVFSYFRVSDRYQPRVLFWGVAGAVVMRAIFIVVGTSLLGRFHWMTYVFGAFLVFTGVKLGFHKEESVDVEGNIALKLARRFLRTTDKLDGERFFTLENGRRVATPLLLVLVVIELTDVMFAVDSVPAVLAISNDTFIVYTSNIMAVLGLRSLYFLLSGMMGRFHYLDVGLSVILVFVGLKMLGSSLITIPNAISLAVIAGVLALAVTASLLRPVERTSSTGDE